MSKEKKILVVDLIGSLPVYTAFFSGALASNGITTHTLSPRNHKEIDALDFLDLNYKYLANHFGTSGIMKKLIKGITWFLNGVYALILAPRYDALHFIWLPLLKEKESDLVLLRLIKKVNPNIVFTVHATFHHDDYSGGFEERLKKACDIIPKLVTHSEFTRKSLINDLNVADKKVTVMGHGPMFGHFRKTGQKKPNKEFTMALIGFMKKYKGVEDALKLTAHLHEQGKQVKLILAGGISDDYLKILNQLMDTLNIREFVDCQFRYLETPEMIELNRNADCVLAPYYRIGQSGAAITALSLGTPIIGYKNGGLPYIIENFKNGYLAESGDYKGMANGVEWIRNTDPEVIDQGINEFLEKHSWRKTALTLQKLYES